MDFLPKTHHPRNYSQICSNFHANLVHHKPLASLVRQHCTRKFCTSTDSQTDISDLNKSITRLSQYSYHSASLLHCFAQTRTFFYLFFLSKDIRSSTFLALQIHLPAPTSPIYFYHAPKHPSKAHVPIWVLSPRSILNRDHSTVQLSRLTDLPPGSILVLPKNATLQLHLLESRCRSRPRPRPDLGLRLWTHLPPARDCVCMKPSSRRVQKSGSAEVRPGPQETLAMCRTWRAMMKKKMGRRNTRSQIHMSIPILILKRSLPRLSRLWSVPPKIVVAKLIVQPPRSSRTWQQRCVFVVRG
jgi:hypothetical protein